MTKNKETVNIHPTPGIILLEPMEAQTKTAAGIYLPDTAKEKTTTGLVLEVGGPIVVNGINLESPVKKGDKVYYREWSGSKIKVQGKEFLFAKFEDILGVIK